MLFHVDMSYLAKQPNAMLKKALIWDENRNQIEPRTGFFFNFMSKRREYADVLPILAQNKSIYRLHVHNSPYLYFGRKKIKPIMFYKGMMPKFSGAVSPSPLW